MDAKSKQPFLVEKGYLCASPPPALLHRCGRAKQLITFKTRSWTRAMAANVSDARPANKAGAQSKRWLTVRAASCPIIQKCLDHFFCWQIKFKSLKVKQLWLFLTLISQEERLLAIAGWWKAAGRGTTGRCWSVRAARAWSPGSTTLSREADYSWREAKTEGKRSRELKGPNMLRFPPVKTALKRSRQENQLQIRRQRTDVFRLQNGLHSILIYIF